MEELLHFEKEISILINYEDISSKQGSLKTKSDYINEYILAIASADFKDDIIIVEVNTLKDSVGMAKNKKGSSKAAVPKQSLFHLQTRIPSILSVDNDVKISFVENLIGCLKIDYSIANGFSAVNFI